MAVVMGFHGWKRNLNSKNDPIKKTIKRKLWLFKLLNKARVQRPALDSLPLPLSLWRCWLTNLKPKPEKKAQGLWRRDAEAAAVVLLLRSLLCCTIRLVYSSCPLRLSPPIHLDSRLGIATYNLVFSSSFKILQFSANLKVLFICLFILFLYVNGISTLSCRFLLIGIIYWFLCLWCFM